MINPILPEKDLRVASLLFNIAKEDEFEINFENEKSYEIDFIPKFRYSNVSGLSFEIAKMDNTDRLIFAQRLHDLCSLHGIATFHKRKLHKTYSPQEFIHILFEKIYNKFGDKSWVEIDENENNGQPEFGHIVKLKFLNMPNNGAWRHNVSFLPYMAENDRPTYDFFIQLLHVLDHSGICNWTDDYNDMVMDFFKGERTCPEIWKDASNSDKKEERARAKANRMEVLSYENGWPHVIAHEFNNCMTSADEILECFYKWATTTSLDIPPSVMEDIEEMCRLLSFGFRIHDYEKHIIYAEETPARNGLLFSIDYDEGAFAHECSDYINSEEQNMGYIELADSIVLNYNGKFTFDHKGSIVQQFLRHWNITKTFSHFNDKYKQLSSRKDGTEISSRVLRKKRGIRKQGTVRGKSPNKKRSSSSRKAVLV